MFTFNKWYENFFQNEFHIDFKNLIKISYLSNFNKIFSWCLFMNKFFYELAIFKKKFKSKKKKFFFVLIWRKTSPQSGVTSSSSSVGFLRCLTSQLGSKSSQVYKNFLLSNMPPTPLMRDFRRGNTEDLFTLENRCTFCYAAHATN